MKEQLINEILLSMTDKLSNEQLYTLKNVLIIKFNNLNITKEINELIINDVDNNYKKLSLFLETKRLEGCSESTLERYKKDISKLLDYINKDIKEITTDHIRYYLSLYQQQRKIKQSTLDNMRRYFSSFFSWLESEDYILKNPMRKIKRIKQPKTIKKPFKDVELEKLRQGTANKRDMAIIEFLNSTAVRVSELTKLNISDINFDTNEIIVNGKGDKEREVYLTEKAMFYLKEYLGTRKDNYNALFIHLNKNCNRIKKGGIEAMLNRLGKKVGVYNVHPHRFRRTFACRGISKNISLAIIQELLGHTKIETTVIYCTVEKEDIKYAHKKFA